MSGCTRFVKARVIAMANAICEKARSVTPTTLGFEHRERKLTVDDARLRMINTTQMEE